MAINPIDAYKYQPVNNYAFGGLTNSNKTAVNGNAENIDRTSKVGSTQPAFSSESLVARLDRMDANSVRPNVEGTSSQSAQSTKRVNKVDGSNQYVNNLSLYNAISSVPEYRSPDTRQDDTTLYLMA